MASTSRNLSAEASHFLKGPPISFSGYFGVSINPFFLEMPLKFLQVPFFKLTPAFSDSLWEQGLFNNYIYSPRDTGDFDSNKISIFPSNAGLLDLSRAAGPQSALSFTCLPES